MFLETSISTKKFSKEILSVFQLFQSKPAQKALCSYQPIAECGKDRSVAISCIGSSRMKSLNQTYRQKTSSTDILSFEINEGTVWGELYVCPDDIEKNAKMMGHSFENELIEILIHGFLHLTGMDHCLEMFEWQKKLTEAILNLGIRD